jgi:hypothetical protein
MEKPEREKHNPTHREGVTGWIRAPWETSYTLYTGGEQKIGVKNT